MVTLTVSSPDAAPPVQEPRPREDATRRQKGKIACKFFGTKSGKWAIAVLFSGTNYRTRVVCFIRDR